MLEKVEDLFSKDDPIQRHGSGHSTEGHPVGPLPPSKKPLKTSALKGHHSDEDVVRSAR